MSDILNKNLVLVLNCNWQAINIRTPADAFCQMATNAATVLDIVLGADASAEALRPVKWDEWIMLPVRHGDNFVRTASSACDRYRGRELRQGAEEAPEALRARHPRA
jgi:hypothetical protein